MERSGLDRAPEPAEPAAGGLDPAVSAGVYVSGMTGPKHLVHAILTVSHSGCGRRSGLDAEAFLVGGCGCEAFGLDGAADT